MCYREEWFDGRSQDEMTRKRAELKAKRERAQFAKAPLRRSEPHTSSKPSNSEVEARVEEIV